MNHAQKLLRRMVLRTSRYSLLDGLYRFSYSAALALYVRVLRRFPEIEAIYLRGSLATGAWIPGDSDIDLTVVIRDMPSSEEVDFLGRFWGRHALLAIFFPFFRWQDVAVLSWTEISNHDLLRRCFPPVTKGSDHGHWKLLCGKEARDPKTIQATVRPQPDHSFLASFCHSLFEPLYRDPLPTKGPIFLRRYHGIPVKILKLIYAHETGELLESEPALFQHFLERHGSASQPLLEVLSRMKLNDYWSTDVPKELLQCLHGTMRILEDFYKILDAESRDNEKAFPLRPQKMEGYAESSAEVLTYARDFAEKISRSGVPLRGLFLCPVLDTDKYDLFIVIESACGFEEFQSLALAATTERSGLAAYGIYPFILMDNFFRGAVRFFPLTYFHIMSFGRAIHGDVTKMLEPPSEEVTRGRLSAAASILPLHLRHLLGRRFNPATALVVYRLLSDVLTYRLLKDQDFVSVMPLQDYCEHYGREPETAGLLAFRRALDTRAMEKTDAYALAHFTRHLLKRVES